jgi:PAP2 superfamily
MAAITYLAGPGGSALPVGPRQGSWLAGAGFPDPAVLAGLVAVTVAAAPWLSRPWRRAAWAMLLLIGAARLVTGGLLPMQVVLALATGVTVGAGLLVAFGVPDRRMGCAGVAAALRAGGVPVGQVTGPLATAKGSRPFEAVTGDGRALFGASFPSGHAIAASVTVVAAVIALIPAGRRRTWWGAAAVAFSIVMGLSRAYLAAHWLSDATAGILLGTSCALVTALVADQCQRRRHRLQGPAGTQFLAGVPPAHHAEDNR